MRGLDPRIHALSCVANARFEDVGRIMSGQDDVEPPDAHRMPWSQLVSRVFPNDSADYRGCSANTLKCQGA